MRLIFFNSFVEIKVFFFIFLRKMSKKWFLHQVRSSILDDDAGTLGSELHGNAAANAIDASHNELSNGLLI